MRKRREEGGEVRAVTGASACQVFFAKGPYTVYWGDMKIPNLQRRTLRERLSNFPRSKQVRLGSTSLCLKSPFYHVSQTAQSSGRMKMGSWCGSVSPNPMMAR